MCGILCLLNVNSAKTISDNLVKILKNRGPDAHNFTNEMNNLLCFYGFVLWQQGSKPFSQPAVTDRIILLLNGDIFNASKIDGMSDTEWLSLQLGECDTDEDIFRFFTNLEGPYSIIFYIKRTKTLYFARDPLGRNSLLAERCSEDSSIKISSTSNLANSTNVCIEIPPVGIYKLPLKYNETTKSVEFEFLELFLWKKILPSHKESIENVFQVPFLENSSFGKDNMKSLEEIHSQDKYFNFYEFVTDDDLDLSKFLKIEEISSCVEKILELLTLSVKDRILTNPKFCSNCIPELKPCNHSKLGILFSGGLDCTILARLAHEFCDKLEPIDLINVSFENINSKDESNIDWNTPDRISALNSYEMLCALLPERKWNFVQVNVTRKELVNMLRNHIKHLIFPLKTVLDESLGAAFWFASRGVGLLKDQNYNSPCRVILLGSGADELFGGYTRHRNAFSRTQGDFLAKIETVGKELTMDWERIAFRNLGRDDRVIADNCKTARSPFIEEKFTAYVTNLKPEQKCCFKFRQGVGDKLLLRICGFKLGLIYSSTLQKRAIQFGSKIANKKQNATDISNFLIQ